jgi:hypothetical protein
MNSSRSTSKGPCSCYIYAVVEDDMSSPGSPEFMITQRLKNRAVYYTLARVYGEANAVLIAGLLNKHGANRDHPITKAVVSGAEG